MPYLVDLANRDVNAYVAESISGLWFFYIDYMLREPFLILKSDKNPLLFPPGYFMFFLIKKYVKHNSNSR